MRKLSVAVVATVMALGMVGCEPATKEDANAIKEQLEQLTKKVDALGRKVASGGGAQANNRRQPPAEDYNKVHQIDLAGAAFLGNPNAPVTVVEFSDFECPFCARAAPDAKAIAEKYPDQVRVAFMNFPLSFHRAARPTAIGGLVAKEQGKFWEYHDVLFKKTAAKQLKGSDADLIAYAEEAGCDVEKFKADLESRRAEFDKIVTAQFTAGQNATVRGTPTFFINGKKVQDRGVAGMSRTIDALLKDS